MENKNENNEVTDRRTLFDKLGRMFDRILNDGELMLMIMFIILLMVFGTLLFTIKITVPF